MRTSAAQPLLLDTGVALPGLAQAEGIVSPGEEGVLIAAIDAAELSPFRFHQWLGKRLTLSFGWHYDFDDSSFTAGEPIPDWLLPLRARAADFAGLPANVLEQASLIRYDPGAGIGWHKDRPVFGVIVGVSLGAPATMRFRRRKSGGGFERTSAQLAPRGIYRLAGEVRHQWEHSISPMDRPRWSITFRSLSDKGRAQASQS
jgi:DNA oxidative demethylase